MNIGPTAKPKVGDKLHFKAYQASKDIYVGVIEVFTK